MKEKKEIGEVTLINQETGEEFKIQPVDTELVTNGKIEVPVPDIIFYGADNLEIMKLKANGDIYVKGNLIENDSEVVDGLREFLTSHGVR